MIKKLTVVLAAVALSACSHSGAPSAGAGAGSESNTGTDSGTALSWLKSLSFTKSAKATVTVPAQTLIGQELSKNISNPAAVRDISFTMISPDRYFAESVIDSTVKALEGAQKAAGRENAIHWRGEMAIASALAPTTGWPCDMLAANGGPFFTPKKAQEARECGTKFMDGQETAILFSNALFLRLADRLSPSVLADPDEAAARIRKEWEAIPAQEIVNTWNQAATKAAGQKTVDMTGFSGVRFMDGQGDFQGTAQGFVMLKNSMPFFGGGYIGGKQITLGLESNISKSQQKSSNTTESSRGGAGTGASSSTR